MGELASFVREGEAGIITINNPPVNALSPGVPEAIYLALQRAVADEAVRTIVLIGGGRTFIAGADIREFEKIVCGARDKDLGLHPMLRALEECPKPIVCAIHGTAFGGGLEVAMACHYRVAVPQAQVAQPEVKLGLIPGAGGTQRLPRLAGVGKALEMCSLGEPISAEEALRFGIVDRLFEGDLVTGALEVAREAALEGGVPRRTSQCNSKLENREFCEPLFSKAREEVRRRFRGRIAPLKAIDAVEAATKLPFEEGLEKERELFEDCLYSDQARALIRSFFGEREVARVPGVPKETRIAEVGEAGIAGAGTMGRGIAMALANAGIRVLLKDLSREALDRGLAAVRENYAASVKKGRFGQDFADRSLALIGTALSYEDFSNADLVVEAVFESMDAKRQVFAGIGAACKPDAILATNTSSLDIDAIAGAALRPDRVIGLHFFAPANIMRLIEIVRGRDTGSDVIASSMALAKKLGKIGVVVGNGRGFVGNRMFNAYLREAHFLVEEGAKPQEVDAVLYSFGLPMGPFATEDLSGLDVFSRIRQVLAVLDPPDSRHPAVADGLCSAGRFGQKSGAGWYRYNPGDRTPHPDPAIEPIVAACVREQRITQRVISSDEILERTLYALINEGARILEEGIALRAIDIDIIYINGYGFPAHRGGPMWFADSIGLKTIYARILEFQERYGNQWTPAPLLGKLAEGGKTFTDYQPA